MNKKNNVDIIREYKLFQRREKTEKHISYKYEKERCRLIFEGNVDGIEKVLSAEPDGTMGVVSDNNLRNRKNLFISAITMYTRAAIEGGVSEELAFAMSDSYIHNVEALDDIKDIDELYRLALKEFAQAVCDKKGCVLDAKIKKSIEYIKIHLHEKMTLEIIAKYVNINKFSLSKEFKKQTGISIVDYIQKERIDAASYMMIYSDYTDSQISEFLHFPNQSYFIKIFKKYMGMTPARYRKTI